MRGKLSQLTQSYRKNKLIREIKTLNDQFAKSQLYTDDFRQKYAWTVIQLQATNSIIDPVLTVFRFRQIKSQFISLYEEDSQDETEVNEEMIEQAEVVATIPDPSLPNEEPIQILKSFIPTCEEVNTAY